MSRAHLTYGAAGASILWLWTCLVSSAVFVLPKLEGYPGLARSYTSGVMLASTASTCVAMTVLGLRPAWFASRVRWGELTICGVAVLLAVTMVSPVRGPLFYAAVVVMTVAGSVGTSGVQNGVLAITQRAGGEYARALFVGQAVAGVVPPILSLAISLSGVSGDATIAALLFVTCALLAAVALVLFGGKQMHQHVTLAEEESERLPSMQTLHQLLQYLYAPAFSIFMVFAVSLSYPVFANGIEAPGISQASFAPLVHLIWNGGDLAGRTLCQSERFQVRTGRGLVQYAVARVLFVPALLVLSFRPSPVALYLLVQLAFGITSGHLLSSAISYAPSCVVPEQRPAAGGLLGVVISVGLVAGSLASFPVASLVGHG